MCHEYGKRGETVPPVVLLVTLVQSSALISLTFVYRLLTLRRKAPSPTKNVVICVVIIAALAATGVRYLAERHEEHK